jgi:hypothetical protein
MSLVKTYNEFILEKIFKESLYDGVVLTTEELEAALETYKQLHLDLSFPYIKYVDLLVEERGSSSSASLIKNIVDAFSDDVSVITREIYSIADNSSRYHERWISELERLRVKSKKLENRIDALLLLANNTAGYYASIVDPLSDLNYVDTENTTALVDTIANNVFIKRGTENSGSLTQVNTNSITYKDISFSPISRRGNTFYTEMSTNNSVVQILKNQNTTWVGKISCSTKGPMTAELKIHLSNEQKEISRIVIDSNTPHGHRTTVTALYSVDSHNWNIVPSKQATQYLYDSIAWNFSKRSARWVKFIFYKTSHDSGFYEYIYSLRSIRFYKDAYYEDNGNLFYSIPMSVLKTDDTLYSFAKAQLDVCEVLPTNTNIKYSLAASKDNSTWTSWYSINPSTREDVNYPKIVAFSGIDWKDNTSSDITELNSSYEKNVLVSTFDDSDIETYRLRPSCAVVNSKISISSEEDLEPVANSVVVWRNTLDRSTFPDTTTVRDVVRGWSLNGQTYGCYFEILNPNGRLIDFGARECVLDGNNVSGVVNLGMGVHKFQTAAENWFDISSSIESISVGSEEILKSVDPLYPYNHKLLVEGFPYLLGFEGTKVYLGADRVAESYMKRVSLFDLENNIFDYDSFAIRDISNAENNPIIGIVVRYNQENVDFVNELFLVKWRSGGDNASLYKYIKLQAELLTDDSETSPSFSSYRIKLGV